MAGQESDILIVANRLPVKRVEREGEPGWETSPGGLVSAMMPILQSGSGSPGGAWIGWNGVSDERLDPFEHDGILNVPVSISEDQLSGYYDGMANSTLWPLYHDAVRPAIYHRKWWRRYYEVNQLFAEAAATHAAPDALVWVHDYHLHMVPEMLRQRRPDLRIGYFLHIPFPGRGLFAQLPWRTQLIRGTLGADVVGFQTEYGARNFIDLALRYADAQPSEQGVMIDGRQVRIGAYPISIDSSKYEAIARREDVRRKAEQFREQVGGRRILLGVDRLDYTKGIDLRLRAYQDLLETGRISIDEAVLVQSAVPTRELVDDYAQLRSTIEEMVGQINGTYAEVGTPAVEYLRRNLPAEDLVALYVAADVMLVTPYRDGMNLVAKEYVASKADGRGVLVLSEFTGAAEELREALIVNPHDLDGLAAGMEYSVRMPDDEASRRLQVLRSQVMEHDVYAWADRFLLHTRG